ncbi:hypothetical protein DDE18_05275 [Nocardioides gansuensis]|uniref:Uncharacterized protein n=1 Tax=Nocardioides gansuensis TaxID=2138300 RepID=A0A2T8FDE3_9ACTN|nr:hypothetical protein [Nocardioides gansuensis]PVG83731.1 hypothetical protein DDE18_05275 [Nocardioides gansuensis]
MISRALLRIPAEHRKPIAQGLLWVAGIAAFFGALDFPMFLIKTEEKCKGHLWAKECKDVPIPLGDRVPHLLIAIGLFSIALICVFAAWRLISTQGHLKKYQAILTGVEAMDIGRIADITRSSPSRVRTEIQTLIDSDEISDFYIDYQRDQVVSKKYVPKSSHKTVVTCRLCGAHNELIVGITRSCAACGEPLILKAR